MQKIIEKPRIAGGDGDDFESIDKGILAAQRYANNGGLVLRTVSLPQGREVIAGPGLALDNRGVRFVGYAMLSRSMPEIHHSLN